MAKRKAQRELKCECGSKRFLIDEADISFTGIPMTFKGNTYDYDISKAESHGGWDWVRENSVTCRACKKQYQMEVRVGNDFEFILKPVEEAGKNQAAVGESDSPGGPDA